MSFTDAERLKFMLFAEGMAITPEAQNRLDEHRQERPLTPADFASTTGLILALQDDVWVNAPIRAFNPNFVDEPDNVLDIDGDGFVVSGNGLSSRAEVWLPPAYLGRAQVAGRPIDHFVFSHGDRVRLSPIRGCAMRCKFCNVPYEDPYETKPGEAMVPALRIALEDPLQPAHHVLISGGTPRGRDIPYLRGVYEAVLTELAGIDVDIMMVPIDGLIDVARLHELGLHELSINIELSDPVAAKQLMPQKDRQGLGTYLRFIAEAADILGPGRVRSMVMVGLESQAATLTGVEAILKAGGVPVLSPFRPDPATPLRDWRPLDAQELMDVYEAARELAATLGSELGPDCPTCTHNTLTLARDGGVPPVYPYPRPVMV